MKQVSKSKCPRCGSGTFISLPNRYDCLKFANGAFQVGKSEFTDDKERFFCRECGAEVDEKASVQNKEVVLSVKGKIEEKYKLRQKRYEIENVETQLTLLEKQKEYLISNK
jgi:hypothetical protein